MDWLKSFLKNPLVRAYILAGLRHVITIAGVALVSHGVIQGSDEQDIIGAAMTIASIILSQYDVKQVDKKINAAIALSPKSSQAVVQALKNGQF